MAIEIIIMKCQQQAISMLSGVINCLVKKVSPVSSSASVSPRHKKKLKRIVKFRVIKKIGIQI
jgi:hypothetical protein